MERELPPSAPRMRSLALDLPNQLESGFRSARELGGGPRTARQAVVVGMGGSAIAADLVRSVTDPETELPLGVTRGPTLPKAIGSDAWAILASYSGQTWETLSAYDEAGRRSMPRLAISSGGELAKRAERDHVPHLLLPPGLPPRAALGYMFGGLMGALDPFFPESNERRMHAAIARLRELGLTLSRPGGPADRVAREIGGRKPYIYADVTFAGLARRWKTQIEENAKRLAHFDLIPELFHNALVAWDALPKAETKETAVIFLEWREESPSIRWGFRYLEGLLSARGVRTQRIDLGSEDRLPAILEGVTFGDHVSLFLAEAAGIDPMPVEAIVRLKKAQEAQGLGRDPVVVAPRRAPVRSPKRRA